MLLAWSDTFTPGASKKKKTTHDGSPFCEGDQSHLSAVPVLLCSGGKERYVRELYPNMYAARVVCFALLFARPTFT